MSIKTSELITAINEFAPSDLQEYWDNTGWQINFCYEKVDKVLVALEIVEGTIQEAKNLGADFILTHHPLFFTEFKKVEISSLNGRYLIDLVRAGISVFSAHTSFDSAEGGMNDRLATLCGLKDIKHITPSETSKPGTTQESAALASMPRCGVLSKKTKFIEYIAFVEEALDMKGRLKIVGSPNTIIQKVAVCGGAGGNFISDLIAMDFDLFITSDVKHNQAQLAKEKGLCVIDGGHFGTEQHFTEVAAANLRKVFGDKIEVFETNVSADPFQVL